ncbi:MAG: hypothetical protein CMM60_06155 [Rhodospirillaceae bacterium]|jgi:hypothetical protein|nr:hypothetical protein [Rhodospirillaceae bacterium]|tara:strand:+ start:4894 stop:5214 length:321 start_codon:yes stop_codon:yes gene_type:complete
MGAAAAAFQAHRVRCPMLAIRRHHHASGAFPDELGRMNLGSRRMGSLCWISSTGYTEKKKVPHFDGSSLASVDQLAAAASNLFDVTTVTEAESRFKDLKIMKPKPT